MTNICSIKWFACVALSSWAMVAGGCATPFQTWSERVDPIASSLHQGKTIDDIPEVRDPEIYSRGLPIVERSNDKIELSVKIGTLAASSVTGVILSKQTIDGKEYVVYLVGDSQWSWRMDGSGFTTSSIRPAVSYVDPKTKDIRWHWGSSDDSGTAQYVDTQWKNASSKAIEPQAGHRTVFPHKSDKFRFEVRGRSIVIHEDMTDATWTVAVPG